MRPLNVFLILAIAVIVLLLLTWPDEAGGPLGWLSPEPTAVPTVCDRFDFSGMLPQGTALRGVFSLDTSGDGSGDCVVLYDELLPDKNANQRAVYGFVYYVALSGEADPDGGTFPVSDVHRYDLEVKERRRVRLGLAVNGTSTFRVLSIDADSRTDLELVVIQEDSGGQPLGLSIFRWDEGRAAYDLVGYAHGDWIETDPDPIERYVDEVIVCDRQFPTQADNPDQVEGRLFLWEDGQLVPDSLLPNVRCSR